MSQQHPANRQIAIALVSLVVFMVGLSFLSVPLYNLFCRMTGYGGTPQVGAIVTPNKIYDRIITVSFITDTDPGLPWDFKPELRKIDVKVGQTALVNFTAHN
jgi:cytochrome c oxidase assembly protein subunit 11